MRASGSPARLDAEAGLFDQKGLRRRGLQEVCTKRLRRGFCHPFGRVPDGHDNRAKAVRCFASLRHAAFCSRTESGADTYAKPLSI